MLSAEQIAERLADSLEAADGRRPDAVPRHRTLRATLDWSYELLSESTSRGCSGGSRSSPAAGRWRRQRRWEPEAASRRRRPGSALGRLVDKSLVVARLRRRAPCATGCSSPSGSTRGRNWRRAGKRKLSSAGTPSSSWPWPKRPSRSSRGRGRRSGWTAWRPSTTTSGPRSPGRWSEARGRTGAAVGGGLGSSGHTRVLGRGAQVARRGAGEVQPGIDGGTSKRAR